MVKRLDGLFTSPFFVLFQVEVCINLILWDWPNFILRTSVTWAFCVLYSVIFSSSQHAARDKHIVVESNTAKNFRTFRFIEILLVCYYT